MQCYGSESRCIMKQPLEQGTKQRLVPPSDLRLCVQPLSPSSVKSKRVTKYCFHRSSLEGSNFHVALGPVIEGGQQREAETKLIW